MCSKSTTALSLSLSTGKVWMDLSKLCSSNADFKNKRIGNKSINLKIFNIKNKCPVFVDQ